MITLNNIVFSLFTLLFVSCSNVYNLQKVSIPTMECSAHPLYSYHELQYLSCDYKSGVSRDRRDNPINPQPEIVDPLTSSVFNQTEKHLKIASKAWIYALMSSNAYRKGGKAFIIPGWEFTRYESNSGLALEEWIRKNPANKVEEIVIAFEGTNFKSFKDWKTNLSFCLPRQYKEAHCYFKKLLNDYPEVPIIVTGHSLGGGIALNISLRFPNIGFFGFDSSPRGFYKTKNLKRYKDEKAERIFIHERGEVLMPVRFLWTSKLKKVGYRYWFNYLDFNVKSFPIVAEHDMYLIARGLLMTAIKAGNEEAGITFSANFQGINLDKKFEEFVSIKKEKSDCEIQHDIDSCLEIFQKYSYNP